MRTATKAMAVGALLLGIAGTAGAADITFTAEFKPSANSLHNRFVNTTPQSGYCVALPQECAALGQFSVALPIGNVAYHSMAPGDEGRNAAYFSFPSTPLPITVTHTESGATETVIFRVGAFSASYSVKSGASSLTGGGTHRDLWREGSWVFPPPGCGYGGVGSGNDYLYAFLWVVYPSTDSCTKTPAVDIPSGELSLKGETISIGYELTTPNPLRMKSGTYRGTHTFTVGPGGNFDFGDKATVERNTIEVAFELYVDHLFELHIPPGSDRAVLEPRGGWGAWINRGRPPTRLHRDVPFSLSTSVPFSATLTCPDGPAVNGRCQIRDEARGTAASLDVAITMPQIRTDSGLPAQRLPLRADQPVLLEPEGTTMKMGSQLHIDVDQQEVAEMLRHPGARYRGNITVVFDSEPEP